MKVCDRCGSFDGEHDWVPGDCVLPHRRHSMELVTDGPVCVWCIERHREWLAEVLDLYARLGEVLEPGSIVDDTAVHQHTRQSVEPELVRLDAFAMLFDTHRMYANTGAGYLSSALPDVPAVLTGWAQAVCDVQRLAGASLDSTLATACTLLDAHAERIAGMDLVGDYDAELGWCRRALQRAHGITVPRPLGRCLSVTDDGSCPGWVWRDPNGGQARCGRCGRRYGKMSLVRLKISTELEAQ